MNTAAQTAPPPEKLRPGDRLEDLPLESWGRLGEAMAWHNGQPVFVFGGIPGERVTAQITRVHRQYAAAAVVEVLQPAPSRVTPPCQYFGPCTGCQWQHLDYDAQLAAKREKVVDALIRVGGLFDDPADAPVADVIPSPDRYGYRNHARFTVGPPKRRRAANAGGAANAAPGGAESPSIPPNNAAPGRGETPSIPTNGGELKGGQLGFVNRETRQFVRVDYCMLMRPSVNAILRRLQDHCQETTQLSIRAGEAGLDGAGEYLVQPPLLNPEIAIATGQKRYIETIGRTRFYVSSPSFFQVNAAQAARAAEIVREGLALAPEDVLLDAYTGVGAFAVLLAPYVRKVIAVEESAAAVTDARENAADFPAIEFVLGRTETVLDQLPVQPDAVVLDPPRAGCQTQALHKLAELAPPRVAYVSCDPETLARDLKILTAAGYALQRVIPIDMFPQTHHVECVALLRWAAAPAANALTLASASPRRRDLMNDLGLDFHIRPADIPEDALPGEAPQEMVERLSLEKARKVAAATPTGFVIGADSAVVAGGQAIGKPRDDADARKMLRRLRGTTHHVCTGLTVINAANGQSLTDSMTSRITLRNFTDAEIEASITSGVPRDKAGAYAVQDTALRPASDWQGCYPNIIGLPTCRLLAMLRQLGWAPPTSWPPPPTAVCGPDCPVNAPVPVPGEVNPEIPGGAGVNPEIPSPAGGGLGWGEAE